MMPSSREPSEGSSWACTSVLGGSATSRGLRRLHESETRASRLNPPLDLLDPEGEGVYLRADQPFVYMRAAVLLFEDARDWRNVDWQGVYMEPRDGTDEWFPANVGKHPRGWRLNLPKRWRPVLYAYMTPKPEPLSEHPGSDATAKAAARAIPKEAGGV